MRNCRAVWPVLIAVLLFPPVFAQNGDTRPIGRFIEKEAKKTRSEEYVEARKVVRADLNRDGRDDAVVLYTLESFGGSNDYAQFLVVFLASKNDSLRVAAQKMIGGKNRRAIDSLTVENGIIRLGTLNYARSDASCCPSKKGKIQITLIGRRLVEKILEE